MDCALTYKKRALFTRTWTLSALIECINDSGSVMLDKASMREQMEYRRRLKNRGHS